MKSYFHTIAKSVIAFLLRELLLREIIFGTI
jgi:hypothetical protein